MEEDSTTEIGIEISKTSNEMDRGQQILIFLLDDEWKKIWKKSSQLNLAKENIKLHKKIKAY